MQGRKTTLPAGSIIRHRYKVERLLGKGGFGAVYLVSDRRVRSNVFALKEVFDAERSERQRFTFEGQVLSRLDHLSLPRVYRTFEDAENARAYLLMDYIAGQNLEVLRKQQPNNQYPVAQVLHLMEPIFNAVGYLHRQQPPVIHRDIKPSNIIVPSLDEPAVLVDFGIAKEYVQDSTTAALRLCSPGYSAPEQYSRGTDRRTDVYGLAATMYVLLTGQLPADALHRMANIGRKRGDALVAPRELVPTIPQQVSDALVRAMSIASDERFAAVDEFWQELHAQPIPESADRPDEKALPLGATPRETRDIHRPEKEAGLPPEPEEVLQGAHTMHRMHIQSPWERLVVPMILALVALGAGWVYGSSWFSLAGRGSAPRLTQAVPPVVGSPAGIRPMPTAQPTAPPQPTAAPQPVGHGEQQQQAPVPSSQAAEVSHTSTQSHHEQHVQHHLDQSYESQPPTQPTPAPQQPGQPPPKGYEEKSAQQLAQYSEKQQQLYEEKSAQQLAQYSEKQQQSQAQGQPSQQATLDQPLKTLEQGSQQLKAAMQETRQQIGDAVGQ